MDTIKTIGHSHFTEKFLCMPVYTRHKRKNPTEMYEYVIYPCIRNEWIRIMEASRCFCNHKPKPLVYVARKTSSFPSINFPSSWLHVFIKARQQTSSSLQEVLIKHCGEIFRQQRITWMIFWRNLAGFGGFWWILVDFDGFRWVSVGLGGFRCVLVAFGGLFSWFFIIIHNKFHRENTGRILVKKSKCERKMNFLLIFSDFKCDYSPVESFELLGIAWLFLAVGGFFNFLIFFLFASSLSLTLFLSNKSLESRRAKALVLVRSENQRGGGGEMRLYTLRSTLQPTRVPKGHCMVPQSGHRSWRFIFHEIFGPCFCGVFTG